MAETELTRLRAFFSFYGSKYNAAPKYPEPKYDSIIEPFAGSAGYSLLHYQKSIKLYDKDPVIAGLWEYLINVSEEEIYSLPLEITHIDDLKVCQEAKWLIGFWVARAVENPRKSPGAWMRSGIRPHSFWGPTIQERIASQLKYIRHWEIKNCSYEDVENERATWFIDPPYSAPAGRIYKYSAIDYDNLGDWCKGLTGQTIVCEQYGSDWLPFEPFIEIRPTNGTNRPKNSKEVIWVNEN